MNKLLKYIKGSALICAIIAPIMMMIEVTMDLNQPKLMANIIDVGVANGNINYVLSVGIKMILFAAIGVIGGIGCTAFSSYASMSMGREIRQALFDKIQKLSFVELDKFKTSSLITRLTNDVTQVQNMVLMSLRIMVRAPLLCIGGIIMAYTLSHKLSLIFVVAVPVILTCIIYIIINSIPLFLSVQKKLDRVNTVMRENLLGIRVVKAFTLEEKQSQRFSVSNDELMEDSIKAQKITIVLWPIVNLVMNFSIVAVLWFGGNMSISNKFQTGQIMAFVNYLVQIMNSLMMVVMMIINLSRAKVSAYRINEVLKVDVSIKEIPEPYNIKKYDIEFKDVYFKYNKDGEYVLKGISFKANEGERIGIIGATGSGKSSLINLISRIYDTYRGTVLIGGIDIKKIKLKELRKNIGVVMQDTILFSGTIEDNLRFGDQNAPMNLIENSVYDAEAYDFIHNMPEGYKSIVEQRGKNLSGGQKQRISIARTLVMNPKILIMDDSTSAVDMSTEAKLQSAIKERMKKNTVFIIAQRISAVMDADKIIVIDNGCIAAEGTHRELLKTNEIYRSIVISQLGEEVINNA